MKNNKLIDIVKLIAFKKLFSNKKKKIIVYGCPSFLIEYLNEIPKNEKNISNSVIVVPKYFDQKFNSFFRFSRLFVRLNLLFLRSLFLKLIINIFSQRRAFNSESNIVFLIIF